MATAKHDENRNPTLIGVSSVDLETPINVAVNPVTGYIKVDSSVSDIAAINGLKDNAVVGADNQGFMALGTDGANYQVLSTDATGHLQVDILNASLAVTGTFWQVTQPVSNAGLTSLNGAIAGSEVQVDVLTLPAITATNLDIRDLTAVSDSVEVKQATGTNLHVVVDTAPTTAVTGTFWQATQPVSLASVPSHAVTNAGTFVVQENGAALTALQLIDNIVPSINGAGAPTIDSYTHLAINLAAGANQVLVSSAANKQIWIYGLGFTTSVAGTVSFQDEDDTAITGVMPFATNSGMVINPSGNFAMPIWKLATNKDLEVDVVTSDIDGWLDYAIISV